MYASAAAVTQETRRLASEGVNLLNFWRLAPDEAGHVAQALALLDLPPGAKVVDLGSGTGQFARLAGDVAEFTLVNDCAEQLDQSPDGAWTYLADMSDTRLPGVRYDAAILAYALGHADVVNTLEEAHRLLKPGGKVFLHDIWAPNHVVAKRVRDTLGYAAHPRALVQLWARLIGFDVAHFVQDTFLAPGAVVASALAAGLLDDLSHGVLVLQKTDRPHKFKGRKTALQFSGGKDSLACLYALRPFLAKCIKVYTLDTGDMLPETRALIDSEQLDIQWIKSDARAWRREHGDPSDIVPAHCHTIGRAYGMSEVKISNRFDCCIENLMRPMLQRMLDDGIDLIIRGTKEADTGKLPFEGVAHGVELWLPLREFTHDDVFSFLRDMGAPTNPVYQYATGISAPECLTCTAWWDDHKAAYLKARHPEVHQSYLAALRVTEAEINKHLTHLRVELD